MSTLSLRFPGMQAQTVLDTRSLRVRGVAALGGVRRNLFGCTDREENRRFVERELARQLKLDGKRWDFDFTNEKPLPYPQRFAWQLVPASSVPVALRRSLITPIPETSSPEPQVSNPENAKTQKKITEFMMPRKRLANSDSKSPTVPKDESGQEAHVCPPKMARLDQIHLERPS